MTFKKFGIQLTFTPTVLSDGLINLYSATEVSEIEAVTLNGFNRSAPPRESESTSVRIKPMARASALAGFVSDKRALRSPRSPC